MANQFFSNFPIVTYNNVSLRNMMVKAHIIRGIIEKFGLYHPLTIQEGERPDTIAFDYYGDSELYWIVFMSNEIVDPYFDWPLDQADFREYIIKKYGTIQAAMQTVIGWRNANENYMMSPVSKSLLSSDEIQGWTIPVYAYDNELEINEAKREIRLLDKGLVPQVLTEVSKIFK